MKRTLRSAKSHQGCHRCKWKKIKCDETKPACLACQRAGDECPGFAPRYKWVRKHEKWNSSERREDMSQNTEIGQTSTPPQEPPASTSHITPANNQPVTETAATSTEHDDVSFRYDQASLEPDFASWLDYDTMAMEDCNFLANPSFSVASMFERTTAWPLAISDIAIPLPGTSQELHHDRSEDRSHPEQPMDVERSITPPPSTARSAEQGNLLETFYRMSLPPTSVAQFSGEHLVKHYFVEVCPLYSCFDSELNPFRTLIQEMWRNSSTIYYTIKSMAAANLANHYLYMEPVILRERSKAWKSLQLDLQLHRKGKLPLERLLISLLLLGLSAPWHKSSNLGLQYLFIARALMQAHIQGKGSRHPHQALPNESFFRDALMYWEMLASFVEPTPKMTFAGFGSPIPQLSTQQGPRLPHSWAGLSTELHFVLAEVGRILRARQNQLPCPYHARRHADDHCEYEEKWAASLERFLRSISIPDETEVAEYDDESTPKSDLVRTAHAHRYIALLEIYCAFPRLLKSYIDTSEEFPPAYDRDFDAPTEPWDDGGAQYSWLFAIAIRALDMLKAISISSAACRLQPLILIACASQLRFPRTEVESTDQENIVEKRWFVEERMLALSRKYPQKPHLQMLDVVKEVWHRLDNGSNSAHWLEVIHEKGWQTMMG